jgi:sterol 14-demethylase
MLIGVLFAGQHTSSITSTWTIFNLLHHRVYYERVMAEQAKVLGEAYSKGPSHTREGLTFDSVSQMSNMHQAMKESHRQYPPLIMLMRKTHVPLEVCGGKYTVPKDHYIFAVPAVSMNLPKGPDSPFTDPERFDPDRYSEGRAEDKVKPYSYTAFGGGIHACLGEQFGYLQVKTILSIMLRKFDIEMTGPLPKPDYTMMVVGPTTPRMVRFKRRTVAHVAKA